MGPNFLTAPSPVRSLHESPPANVRDFVRSCGRFSLAYSLLQPGMAYFGDARSGYIAYVERMGCAVALGDPLCDDVHKEILCKAFISTFKGRPAGFAQASLGTAKVLGGLGLKVTPLGQELTLDLNDFSLDGKDKQDLRHYRNKAVSSGIAVHEMNGTAEARAGLEHITLDWMRSKIVSKRELAFYARPFTKTPEEDVRIFVGSIDDDPAGFVLFDPLYENENIFGYTVCILRCTRDAPEGTLDYIVLCAAEEFRKSGRNKLCLGLAPFHHIRGLNARYGSGSPVLNWAFRSLYRHGGKLFNFKSLCFHKTRYRPMEEPAFFCTTTRSGLRESIASLRAANIL